ncbi:MAG: hypothetical protein RIR48_795 [Bacteroidota bacterium]|jgi:hypothetical protein
MNIKLRLSIFDWENGVWGNRNYYFETLEEAKRKMKKEKGRGKIYNMKNQVIYAENNMGNGYSEN